MNLYEAIVQVMNTFDGWELEALTDSPLTAIGKTPKGHDCVFKIHQDQNVAEPYIDHEVMNEFKKYDRVWVYVYQHNETDYWYWMNEVKGIPFMNYIKLKKEHAQFVIH